MDKRQPLSAPVLIRPLAVGLFDVKRIVAVLAAVFALMAMSIQPAAAETVGKIVNLQSMCIGIQGSSTAAGAIAVVGTCSGSATQTWRVRSWAFVGNAFGYQFENGVGMCLGVTGTSTSSGAQVVQGGCKPRDTSQIWRPRSLGDFGSFSSDPGSQDFHLLQNGHSGLCLGVRTGSIVVIQGFCDLSSPTQKWLHPATF